MSIVIENLKKDNKDLENSDNLTNKMDNVLKDIQI